MSGQPASSLKVCLYFWLGRGSPALMCHLAAVAEVLSFHRGAELEAELSAASK